MHQQIPTRIYRMLKNHGFPCIVLGDQFEVDHKYVIDNPDHEFTTKHDRRQRG